MSDTRRGHIDGARPLADDEVWYVAVVEDQRDRALVSLAFWQFIAAIAIMGDVLLAISVVAMFI